VERRGGARHERRHARIAAFAWAAGALFALVSAVLPDATVNDEALLVVVAGVAAGVAMALFVVFDRMPPWGFQVMVAGGTVAASVAAYAWGSASAYEPLPYMWITLFALYFFSLPAALVHMGLIGAGYAVALAAESPPGDPLDGWLATLGTLLLSGMFVLLVRGRILALVASLGDAAHRDALTELLNRRGFDEIFDIELERARRSDTPLSLLLGDLDHFERLNDDHGHTAGDVELRRVARTLRVAKRRFDIAARVGGEEFALLAPDCDEHGAYTLAERMRAEVDLGSAHGERTLTISFGISRTTVSRRTSSCTRRTGRSTGPRGSAATARSSRTPTRLGSELGREPSKARPLHLLPQRRPALRMCGKPELRLQRGRLVVDGHPHASVRAQEGEELAHEARLVAPPHAPLCEHERLAAPGAAAVEGIHRRRPLVGRVPRGADPVHVGPAGPEVARMVLCDLRVPERERHPQQSHPRRRQLGGGGLDRRHLQPTQLVVDGGHLAAAYDERQASPRSLELPDAVGRSARAPGEIVRRVRIVAVVHLRQRPQVGHLALLGEQPAECDEESVARPTGDLCRGQPGLLG